MKRILSVMIISCMLAGVTAYSVEVKNVLAAVSDDYEYANSGDGTSVSISRYNGTASEIEIPASIDGKTVRSIMGIAFLGCESLKSVIVPDSVTNIYAGAFTDCTNLEKITLPDGINQMGGTVFLRCRSLKKITLPAGLTVIKGSLFNECVQLAEITIPAGINSIEGSAFYKCGNLQNVYYTGTKEQWKAVQIDESGNDALLNAVIHCSDGILSDNISSEYEYIDLDDGTIEITKYNGTSAKAEIPAQIDGKTVTSIGEGAFNNCEQLVEVWLPESVTNIGDYAFAVCQDLARISFEGVTHIGEYAFSGCMGLYEISFPDGLTSIGDYAFNSCENLAGIRIPEGVTSIGYGSFYDCGSMTQASIPDTVTSIGDSAFFNCKALTHMTVPGGLTEIGQGVFESCKGLKQVEIPVSVTEIGRYAFSQCSSLTDVYYEGTKEQWGKITIDSGSGLVRDEITIHYAGSEPEEEFEFVTLDDGTVSIQKYTGSDEVIRIPEELDGKRVTHIESNMFGDKERLIPKEIFIPSGVTGIDEQAFENCPNLTAIHADNASQGYASEDGVLFNKEKTKLVRYPEGKKDSQYRIPSSVKEIGASAFHRCKNLLEISIPDEVNRMGNMAFAECMNLEKIRIPEKLKEIEEYVFAFCQSLKEFEIPQGVERINRGAFRECWNMKSISVPVTVTQIDMYAFSYTDGPADWLMDIYYGGTKEQWEQIEVTALDSEIVPEDIVVVKLRLNADIHYNSGPIVLPEDPVLPAVRNPKEELERLKSADPFSLEQDFSHYLTAEQMDILESYLFTWLAEVNYAYLYSGSSDVKELVMKKTGIDPQGDFASGTEQAITHVSVKTPFGMKTFEITMGLGKPDSSGNLYPGYSVMHYEVLEKGGIPSDVPKSGQIVRNYYTDMGPFVQSVKKAAEDSLHGTYQWENLEDTVTAGILVDKNVSEIVGNRNGSFSDGTFTIFAEPLFAYSKIVHIACPVDVYVYSMDGKEAGSIINNKPSGGNRNVRLDADGDTKTVYLAGDDYYLNLRGTGTGTMNYQVEEIANEDVQRTVQFLELQLKQDMQYEGYVFRPLNIDRDMYALRTKGSSGQEVIFPDSDSYRASFKKVQQLSLSQKNSSLGSDSTVQLSASHLPLDASNPNLRWMTDNESVARVDENGLVTAVGSGRATVTVSTKDGSFLKQFCVIDVAGSGSDNGDSDSTGGGENGGGNTGGSGNDSTGDSGSNGSNSGNGSGGNGSSGNGSGGTGSSSGSSSAGGTGTSAGTSQRPSVVKVHYVLQFDLNGGTKTSRRTMTLLSGDIPGIMPKAQRRDYTFSGWYTQKQGGEKVSGSRPLDAAATLYARWTKASAPAKTASLTLSSKKKGRIQAGFQKVNGAAGYQIEYSANKNFTSAKMKEAKTSAKPKTITGLKAGKKYYVRVRAYSLDSMGNRIYGPYSAVKSIQVKK